MAERAEDGGKQETKDPGVHVQTRLSAVPALDKPCDPVQAEGRDDTEGTVGESQDELNEKVPAEGVDKGPGKSRSLLVGKVAIIVEKGKE